MPLLVVRTTLSKAGHGSDDCSTSSVDSGEDHAIQVSARSEVWQGCGLGLKQTALESLSYHKASLASGNVVQRELAGVGCSRDEHRRSGLR